MVNRQQDYGYEQTLIYGRYNRQLSDFARHQALKYRLGARDLEAPPRSPKCRYRIPTKCQYVLDVLERSLGYVISKVGEDWAFLATLGIVMALLSFCMDFVIEKCQEAKIWVYEALSFSVGLQFLIWVLYSIAFILFATAFTHFISPQAIGSGIPEMKTVLRGIVLKEYLTFRTLVAKVVGLCSSLGSTLPIGKEGPFVHIASIVATLLGKVSIFGGLNKNESRKTEMLAAACAVGVACTFAAPIGGVLFSIEVTSTYFAVRNYWRGFFAAVCGAVVWRLLAHWFKNEETITALFKTHLQTEFPFDALELFIFAAIGYAVLVNRRSVEGGKPTVVCGFAGALFIYLHRKIIVFTRKRKHMSSFLQKNRFIYPGLVALLVSSLTFPPGLGQFTAGEITHKQAIDELFSNVTWSSREAHTIRDEAIIRHWHNSTSNVYVNLALFVISNFCLSCISNTLPVPAGIFFPVFTIGAGFGRLIGESMATWFPYGIGSEVVRKIIPAGYAVVGAAALSGSVTRTISTSLIVFELTGQISHVLPAVIAVLIANGVAHPLQPSFFDSIIKLKRLPYLPDIVSAKSRAWNYFAEDIMVKDVKYMSLASTYRELRDLLLTTYHRMYPLVDSHESMILLGSINRFELEQRLFNQMNPKVREPSPSGDAGGGNETVPDAPHPNSPSSSIDLSDMTGVQTDAPTNMRFQVTLVDDDEDETFREADDRTFVPIPTHVAELRVPPALQRSQSETDVDHIKLQPKSILKKPSPCSSPIHKSESRCHFTEDTIDNEYRRHEKEQALLNEVTDLEGCPVDPAPFQLVERTSLHKVHSLFSLLGLNHAYVTNTGRLVGVVALKELRSAIQGTIDAQSRDAPDAGGPAPQNNSSDEELDDPAMLEIASPSYTEFLLMPRDMPQQSL